MKHTLSGPAPSHEDYKAESPVVSYVHGSSRRSFLTAGIGLALLAGKVGKGWAAPTSEPKSVDVHHHFFPPQYVAKRSKEIMAGTAPGKDAAPILGWTPQASINAMDDAGIKKAIVSISTPGVWFGDVEEARVLARECNEYGARMVADHKGRFGLFSALPLPDVDGALKEIDHAYGALGTDGVGIFSSYNGKWPGDPFFAPIMQELNKRNAIVYVHPTTPACCDHLVPDVGTAAIEYPFDTTRAILSLLYSGTLARCPNIRFIFSHGGGALPMVSGRAINVFDRRPDFKNERGPLGAEHYLKQLYFDTASVGNVAAMGALMKFASPSQVLFGSDMPYRVPRAELRSLTDVKLGADEMTAIMEQNPERLFKRA